MGTLSPGARFRAAMQAEKPLQCVGTINAYHARLAERTGYKSIYLSGGGVAAGSLGLPDLGISNLEDVLTDVRRITDVCSLPLLVDVDTGFGASAFNIARTVKSLIKSGAAAMHIEDQVGAKRCGHRPGKELVSKEEMADRIRKWPIGSRLRSTPGPTPTSSLWRAPMPWPWKASIAPSSVRSRASTRAPTRFFPRP